LIERLPFVLVTGNSGKLREAERLLGFALEQRAIDLPEVQSLDLRVVLEAKADEAWRRLREPLVVDETGLGLFALGGFPGPLIKWLLEAVGVAGLARLATALDDRRATARCALLYTDGRRRVVGEGATRGHLAAEPAGARGFGWDRVFIPEGESATYAQLCDAAKDRIGHRGQAWRDLHQRLMRTP